MKVISYDEAKWRLVPIKPIADMEIAFRRRMQPSDTFTIAYRNMLAASPEPEAQPLEPIGYEYWRNGAFEYYSRERAPLDAQLQAVGWTEVPVYGGPQQNIGLLEAARLVRLWLSDPDVQRMTETSRDACRKVNFWPEWLELAAIDNSTHQETKP